jgi:hypothetical protein
MGRDDPADDGLTGLRDLRADGLFDGPVIFYTSRPTSGQMEQAGELHAAVATTPRQLREQVGQHLPVQPSPQQAS